MRYSGGGVFSDEIDVTRVLFPLGATARVAYRFQLTTPQFQNIVWDNIVDAQTGEVLRRASLTMFQDGPVKPGGGDAGGPGASNLLFGEAGGGPINSRRGTFRPDLQEMVEGFNPTGTA